MELEQIASLSVCDHALMSTHNDTFPLTNAYLNMFLCRALQMLCMQYCPQYQGQGLHYRMLAHKGPFASWQVHSQHICWTSVAIYVEKQS